MLADPTEAAFRRFRKAYRELLAERFRTDREPFDRLAEQARQKKVYIGCNCPTKKQALEERCHTVLALEFMAKKYPDLDVELPG